MIKSGGSNAAKAEDHESRLNPSNTDLRSWQDISAAVWVIIVFAAFFFNNFEWIILKVIGKFD